MLAMHTIKLSLRSLILFVFTTLTPFVQNILLSSWLQTSEMTGRKESLLPDRGDVDGDLAILILHLTCKDITKFAVISHLKVEAIAASNHFLITEPYSSNVPNDLADKHIFRPDMDWSKSPC